MSYQFAASFALGGYALATVIVILALMLAFEIWMFVHCWKNPALSVNAKTLWLTGMIFIHPIVAIIYYFTDRKKSGPPLTYA